ncbi:MAG: PQQ-binding-like beta-propeller repeat protein [Gemmataceae bacterium]
MLSHPSLRALLGMNVLLVLCGLGVLPALRSADRPPRPGAVEPRHLQWVRHEPPLQPTWPDQPRYTSDAAFRPVPVGPLVLLSSSKHDGVTAVDAATGEVRWRFVTDGPVRVAPAGWNDRVFVASDDGHLYCLEAAGGTLVWKFRGGPTERWVLGNERLISSWPARGGPAVAAEPNGEATVYFAAGIWPFMGVFLHALDARTGRPRWQNAGEGSLFIKQPHQAEAFAGIAPQGTLVVDGDRLLVPGGRSIAAGFDRHTGKRLHYRLADSSKLGGGPDVVAGGGVYVNGGGVFDAATGEFLTAVAEPATIADGVFYSVAGTTCQAVTVDLAMAKPPEKGAKKTTRRLTTVGRPGRSARAGDQCAAGRRRLPLWRWAGRGVRAQAAAAAGGNAPGVAAADRRHPAAPDGVGQPPVRQHSRGPIRRLRRRVGETARMHPLRPCPLGARGAGGGRAGLPGANDHRGTAAMRWSGASAAAG